MSPDEDMITDIKASGGNVGEKWWELPLDDDYFEHLKSNCADMKNVGGRFAGSITAGLFLKQFIKKDTRWMHLDMAGPVWHDSHGATGFGAGTLATWVMSKATAGLEAAK
jgi:leucyl aminopeptidase